MERATVVGSFRLLDVAEPPAARVPERQLFLEFEVRDRRVDPLAPTAPCPQKEREWLDGRVDVLLLLVSLAQDTELVTFGVCQYNPRLITLADFDAPCPMGHETSHLGVLVIGSEVEMESALSLLWLVDPNEVQSREAIRLGADLELVIGGVHDSPTKSLGPPPPQGLRI